jgi:hypothetical protein
MGTLRGGAAASADVLTRSLWWLLRNGLILFGLLLAADLLALVLVAPAGLLGPAVGLPITVGLLGLAGYAVRKLVRKREGEARRRRRLELQRARRHRKEQRWSHRLHRLEQVHSSDRVGYCEAASDFAIYGYLGGVFIYGEACIVAFNVWPQLVKSLTIMMVVGGLLLTAIAGAAAAVLYAVHIHHRVHVPQRVQAWRRRRLRRRLARSRGSQAAEHPSIVGMTAGPETPFGPETPLSEVECLAEGE